MKEPRMRIILLFILSFIYPIVLLLVVAILAVLEMSFAVCKWLFVASCIALIAWIFHVLFLSFYVIGASGE